MLHDYVTLGGPFVPARTTQQNPQFGRLELDRRQLLLAGRAPHAAEPQRRLVCHWCKGRARLSMPDHQSKAHANFSSSWLHRYSSAGIVPHLVYVDALKPSSLSLYQSANRRSHPGRCFTFCQILKSRTITATYQPRLTSPMRLTIPKPANSPIAFSFCSRVSVCRRQRSAAWIRRSRARPARVGGLRGRVSRASG